MGDDCLGDCVVVIVVTDFLVVLLLDVVCSGQWRMSENLTLSLCGRAQRPDLQLGWVRYPLLWAFLTSFGVVWVHTHGSMQRKAGIKGCQEEVSEPLSWKWLSKPALTCFTGTGVDILTEVETLCTSKGAQYLQERLQKCQCSGFFMCGFSKACLLTVAPSYSICLHFGVARYRN